MSRENQSSDSPETRLSRMLSYNLTQMIYVVVKLGIPDVLANGPKSVDELASMVNVHSRSLYRLLRALASQGVFIEDRPGHFGLTPLSELLRSVVPGSFYPFALSYGEPWWWKAWGSLLHSVQTGETAFNYVHGMSVFEYLKQNPEAARIFNANMTAMTEIEAQAVVSCYNFSRTRVLVDVGGGHGALVASILRAHPQIHAIIFDLPSVVPGTRRRLEAAGLADRCEIIGGSFFDSIPAGGDTYILKDILHDWDDQPAMTILRNCRHSMGNSARLLIIERVIPAGNDPMPGKLIDISMLVMSGGLERTEAEYRSLLETAGFHLSHIHPTDADTSILEALPV